MIKHFFALFLACYTMSAFAQQVRYLSTPIDLTKIDFETFDVAGFYSQAGNVIYKKPVSGSTDPAAFGYLCGTIAEGMTDKAGTFGGGNYYAISMVVNDKGKLIGLFASAAPAKLEIIAARLKVLQNHYGAPEAAPSKR